MSAAATAVVSSAEGAGDMPSSAPVAGGDSSQDGDQPFSEVLSASSPDHAGSSDAAPLPEPSQRPDQAHDESTTAATTVPEAPAAHKAGAPRERAPRRAGPSDEGGGHVRGAAGLPPLSSAGEADQISLPGSTPPQAKDVAIDVDQTPGATDPLATAVTGVTAVTSAAPGLPLLSTALVPSTASDGPEVSTSPAEAPGGDGVSLLAPAQDGSSPSTVAGPAAQLSHTFGDRSTSDGVSHDPAPADQKGAGAGEARGVADRGTAPGSTAWRSGPVRVQVSGTTPGAASAPSAATTETSGTAAVSAERALEPVEPPDAGGGTGGVDISDLAASISRPLAGGSGDYSVQVSLHPPELGEVRALLSLQGDVLHVTLTPEHSTGFDALSDAMPALHEQLAGGGVEVHVSLGQPGDPEGGHGRGAAEAGPSGEAPSDDAPPPVSVVAIPLGTGGPGRIHLVL